MATTLQYVLSLDDKMSAKLSKIGIGSDAALDKFSKLQKQSNATNKLMGDMGRSIGTLKQKLDLLKAEKEWIPESNLQGIKRYNREIQSLEREISKLDRVQGGFKQNLRGAFDSIPGVGFLTNPIVATGAALFASTKMSMDFNKGMGAINTTAQLTGNQLDGLKKNLLSIDPKYVDDWNAVPAAYESIISQTGDVKQSTDILKASLKGAKGGFTDVGVVSGALAQSLSLIGKENASANEVLDTFFAAKRVGAGEFKDFAQYMPSLIASGDALGIKYKEVAGMFAYMTGKGQSAERSTVLMENAFSAMSKIDVRKNLSDAGINVFDEKGSVRSMTDIFTDLNKRMAGMSDEKKSSFLAQMGLTDKEARSAFIVMSGDINKLRDSMKAVKESAGETDQAFKLSRTEGDRLAELWSNLQRVGITLGGAVGTVLSPALSLVGWAGGYAADALTWLFDGISDGNPVVYGLVAGVTALTIAMKWSSIALKAQDMWLNILIVKEKLMGIGIKAKAAAMYIATAATYVWEAATWALNAAWAASPIGLIVLGVAALGGAIYGVSKMMSSQTAAEKLNGEVKQRALDKTIEQRTELAMLFNHLKSAKVGTDEYKNALKDLEAAYPGVIEKYNLQAGAIGDINKAQQDLIANIDAVAQAEARKEMVREKYKQQFQQEHDIKNGKKTTWESVQTALGNGHLVNATKVAEWRTTKHEIAMLEKDIAKDEMKKAKTPIVNGQTVKLGNGQEKLSAVTEYNTEEKINARIKELTDSKVKMTLGSKEYSTTEAEIARLQNKLNPGKEGGKGGAGSRSNEAIASGGSKQTTITMTFKNIVENITVAGKDFKEAKQDLEGQTTDAIVRALSMATSTAG